MSVVVLVGAAASVLSLYATVPQVLRAARTRSADGVSWSSILLSMATFTLWCVYAFAVTDEIQQARLAVSGAELWGLCPWSTLLAWWGTALWLAYGALAADVALAICCAVLLVMQTVVLVHRLPLRRTLASLAGGRLGGPVARLATPLAARLPQRQAEVRLAA